MIETNETVPSVHDIYFIFHFIFKFSDCEGMSSSLPRGVSEGGLEPVEWL